ncbi:unnamed protein product, partial [Closterium sp. Naga37s-1]
AARGRESKAAALLVDPLPEARNRFSAVIDKISRLYAGSDSDDDDGGMDDGRSAAEGADGGRAGQRGDEGPARGGEGEGGAGEEGWEGWEEGGEWEEEYDTADPFIDDSDLKEYFSSNCKAKRPGFFVNRSDPQHSPPSPASPGGSPSAAARAAGGASLRGTLRGVKQAARAAGGAVAGRGGRGRGGHRAQHVAALGVRRRGALKGGFGGQGGRGGSDRGEDVRHAAKDGVAVANHAWHMKDEAVLYATWQRGFVLWSEVPRWL